MGAIETRRELASYLQSQMEASRSGWAADDEDASRTLVKTYLVEAHPGPDSVLASLEELGRRVDFEARATHDPQLVHLVCHDVDLWCDTSMGRYWRMHTTARVAAADEVHRRIVLGAPWLDDVWLPSDYLEGLASNVGATMLTFSLNHDRRPMSRVEDRDQSDFVSLRLWASRAEETLRKLREGNVFPHGVSVRSVRLHSGEEDFCVAEYFDNGKVTATGTSFDEHTRLVVRVLRDYASLVEGVESRHGIGVAKGKPLVTGDPIRIDVSWTVPDLEYAVRRIFAAAGPFRLWGLPQRLSPGHYRTHATDLHVSGVLTFDITQEAIVVQLPRGVCGNTVVRFLNVLRTHVDADARLVAA